MTNLREQFGVNKVFLATAAISRACHNGGCDTQHLFVSSSARRLPRRSTATVSPLILFNVTLPSDSNTQTPRNSNYWGGSEVVSPAPPSHFHSKHSGYRMDEPRSEA
ncbi:unnamed protein product [Boreogadus saida]